MCPEYEKLREAYVDATHEFNRVLSSSPIRIDAAGRITEAVAFRNSLREHALTHKRRCLRCQNSSPFVE